MTKLTAKALKNELWETLSGIKKGDVDPSEADSICTAAREILRTTNTQLKICYQAKRNVPTELIDFSEGND